MAAARSFLVLIGVAYLVLAVWCVARPEVTAESVGFTLTAGSGQSEYLVLYGGLQLGLAVLFLQPLWRHDRLLPMLEACAILHGCIVALRLYSFFIYSGIGTTTHVLAGLEWVIFLGSLALRRMATASR
ncbi:MAG: hypothetical protein EHM42_04315 [Planctomycetaceae bacterium]|nr:MAG: hypothetical protein EHM42_04315 [Planctomycetaceae bacterium]